MSRAARETLAALTGSGASLVYGTVTQASPLLVQVGTADTATPAVPLRDYWPAVGDYVAILQQGRDRLVVGAVGANDWQTITLASANWTVGRTPEWRQTGGRIELRGVVTRTTATFPTSGSLFVLGSSGNPPTPSQQYTLGGYATVVAATPDSQFFGWVVDPSVPAFRSGAATFTLAIGDVVSLDGIWWPA